MREKGLKISKSFLSMIFIFLLTLVLVACGDKNRDKVKEVLEKIETEAIVFAQGDTKDSVKGDITLKTELDGVTITWTSSKTDVIANDGKVTRPDANTSVALTAKLTLGQAEATVDVLLTVIKKDPVVQEDKLAPVFQGLVGGKLPAINHLKGETVDFLDGVRALDNVDGFDVEIKVLSFGTYTKDTVGVHEITYEATDKAGNKSTVKREVTVIATLEAIINAAFLNDDFVEFIYNDTDAFDNSGTYGAKFRQQDILHVMSKEFFFEQLDEHSPEYPANDGLVLFPYGSMFIVDAEFNIVHVRIQSGVYLQLDEDGVLVHTDVIWNTGVAGGNMFFGLYEDELEDPEGFVVPDGGYVVFGSPLDPQKTRIFINKNLFSSEYVGGVMYATNRDVTEEQFKEIEFRLVEDYKVVIPLPAPLPTPVLTLDRHALTWAPVANAIGYRLFVNGELYNTEELITATSFNLNDLEVEVSETPYEITVQAVTKDMFKWSDSLISEIIEYQKRVLVTLPAPVVTVDAENPYLITWEALEGADSYRVYVEVAGAAKLLETTTETSLNVYDDVYNGQNLYYVIAVGDAEHTDSIASNKVAVNMTRVEYMIIEGFIYPVVQTTAQDYFARRNATDATKPGNYLYLITDIHSVKDLLGTGIYTEAYSSVVLLDENGLPKVIRNILVNEYRVADGWVSGTDTEYKDNGAQLPGLGTYVAEGDMLLIGKNGITVDYIFEGVTKQAAARDAVAYHFINKWDNYPTTPASGTAVGWRATVAELNEISAEPGAEFEIVQALDLPDAPAIEIDENGVITWDAIDNVTNYEVLADGVVIATVEATTYDISTFEFPGVPKDLENGYVVTVRAIDDTSFLRSEDSNEVFFLPEIKKVKLATPVITVDDDADTLTWDAVEGATSYKVFMFLNATTVIELAEVTTNEIDLLEFSLFTQGYSKYRVIAYGNPEETVESEISETVEATTPYTFHKLFTANAEVEFVKVDASVYFAKRNETTATYKLPNALFLLENINALKDGIGSTYTETYSALVLFDENNVPKVVRSITPYEFRTSVGWVTGAGNTQYTSNGAQLAGLGQYIEEGDKLLIGKNEYKANVVVNGVEGIADAREAVAYIFVAPYDTFPTATVSPQGWRGAVGTYVDPTAVLFGFEPIEMPDAPVVEITEAGVLSWDEVESAVGYEIYADGVLIHTLTELEYDLADYEFEVYPANLETGYVVVVKSINDSGVKSANSNVVNYKPEINITQLDTPVVTADGTTLTWESIENATSYKVYANLNTTVSIELAEVTTNALELTEYSLITQGLVKYSVEAHGNESLYITSEKSEMIEVTTPYIKHTFTSGDLAAEYIQIDAVYFFARRNETTVFALPKDVFYVIENVYDIKEKLGGGIYTEANGMIVVLDNELNVKNVRNVVGDYEWSEGVWATGAVSNSQMTGFADKLTEGDIMLIGRNAANVVEIEHNGEAKTANSRDVLAYVFVKQWATFPATGGEGWRDNSSTFIDPSTVVFTLSTSQSV